MTMRLLRCAVTVVALAGLAGAAETVREIDWGRQPATGKGFQVLPPGAGVAWSHVRVTNAKAKPLDVRVLTLDNPGVGQATYALTGVVRYQDVRGGAYLEMWSALPGQGRFFTRTLAPRGPMGQLHGTSDWRAFIVPFNTGFGAPLYPTEITLHVVLPSTGTVELGPLKLVQFRPGEDALTPVGQWWPGWVGGAIGGLLGTLLGLVGALVGVLASTGKARRLVLGLMSAAVVLGVGLLVLGIAAALAHQPYAVYYPLLLAGALSAIIFGAMRPGVRRRYDEMELRRMTAQDVP